MPPCRSAAAAAAVFFSHLWRPKSTAPPAAPSYAFAVSELAKCGLAGEALRHFRRTNAAGAKTDNPTLCTILRCCGEAADLALLRQLHARMVKSGALISQFFSSTLLTSYANCGALIESRLVFEGMINRDVVSWTSILSVLARSGEGIEALVVLKKMIGDGVVPNCVTLASALSGCTAQALCLEQGWILHGVVVKLGLGFSNHVVSSLIDFYSKCGNVDLAKSVFDLQDRKDGIVCNSMINGFALNCKGGEAVEIFNGMRSCGLDLSGYTFSALFNACACLASVCVGRQVHAVSSKIVCIQDSHVSCALIDMYAKCGCVDEARSIFESVQRKNSVVWTSMIMGYAQHGNGEDGINLFEEFLNTGGKPDNISFTAVLTACNHAGLLDEGVRYLRLMNSEYDLVPELDQYACLIDLYCRSGNLQRAKCLIEDMPFEANAAIWSSFLGSCREFGEVELGKEAAERLFLLEPRSSAPYLTLANTFNKAGLSDKAAEVRTFMKSRILVKEKAAWSRIGIV